MKRSFAVPIFLMKFLAFSLAVSLTAIYMGGKVTKTVSSFYVERAPIKTVVDAGHGGRDGGAVADDGTLEKDLNLALASSVAEILKIMGADVVMTRDGDVMYAAENSPHKKLDDLNYRIEKAKSAGDCVFVSIHMNKFPVSKYSGLQVYYSPVNEESKAVAEAVQSAVKAYIQPENDRAVKKSDSSIYLLQNLACPAVLVECGFLSNPAELEKLKDEKYRDSLAAVIAVSVMEYVSSKQ